MAEAPHKNTAVGPQSKWISRTNSQWAQNKLCVCIYNHRSVRHETLPASGQKNVPMMEFTKWFLTLTDAVLQRQPFFSLHGDLCPVTSQAGRPFITSEALGDHTRSGQNMTRSKLELNSSLSVSREYLWLSTKSQNQLSRFWYSGGRWRSVKSGEFLFDAHIFRHAGSQSVQATQPSLPYHDFSCHSSLFIHLTRVVPLCAAPFWCTSAW